MDEAGDREVEALQRMYYMLTIFPPQTCYRMLRWLWERTQDDARRVAKTAAVMEEELP